jgi:ABC-type glycerol-3-phosphate transport system substrate-binding protein
MKRFTVCALLIITAVLTLFGCAVNNPEAVGKENNLLAEKYVAGEYFAESLCDLSDYGSAFVSTLWQGDIYFVSNNKLYAYRFDSDTVSAFDYLPQEGFQIADVCGTDNRLLIAETDSASIVVKSINKNGSAETETGVYNDASAHGSIKLDASGRVFYISEGKIVSIDTNAGSYAEIEPDAPVYQLVCIGTGEIGALIRKNGEFYLSKVDVENRTLADSAVLPSVKTSYTAFDGDSNADAYFICDNELYGIDFQNKSSYLVVDFTKVDIPAQNIGNVCCNDYGDLVCEVYSSSMNKFEILRITNAPSEPQREKTVLKLALFSGWSGNLMIYVSEFNRGNPDYRIEIEQYDRVVTQYQYGFADDNSGTRKFILDVTTGNIPDIIDVSLLPVEMLAQKGLFEDLYPLLDSDPAINRSALYSSVLKAMEIDGHLYHTMSRFQIPTSYGNKELIESVSEWTVEEAIRLAENNTIEYIYGMPAKFFLTTDFCSVYARQFIDWETGMCSFDGPDFISMLKMLKYLPDDWLPADRNQENFPSTLLYVAGLATADVIIEEAESPNISEKFRDEYIFKGLPGTDYGPGMIFDDGPQLAISSTCENKAAAWEFVRGMFSEGYQALGSPTLLCTNKNAQMNYINSRIEAYDATGRDSSYIMPRFEKLMYVLERSGEVQRTDYSLYNIIVEEALAYLAGSKTAEDTAAVIQSRVSMYVAERR